MVLVALGVVLLAGNWDRSNVYSQAIVIDQLLQAHGADLLPPRSVEMTGTVERAEKGVSSCSH
jgi:hypothetical protein